LTNLPVRHRKFAYMCYIFRLKFEESCINTIKLNVHILKSQIKREVNYIYSVWPFLRGWVNRVGLLACLHGYGGRVYPYRVSSNTPFTRSSKHRAIIEQTSSKCIHNTHARRVLLLLERLLDVCLMIA